MNIFGEAKWSNKIHKIHYNTKKKVNICTNLYFVYLRINLLLNSSDVSRYSWWKMERRINASINDTFRSFPFLFFWLKSIPLDRGRTRIRHRVKRWLKINSSKRRAWCLKPPAQWVSHFPSLLEHRWKPYDRRGTGFPENVKYNLLLGQAVNAWKPCVRDNHCKNKLFTSISVYHGEKTHTHTQFFTLCAIDTFLTFDVVKNFILTLILVKTIFNFSTM